MIDALKESIVKPFSLKTDKFTKGELWAVGLFHDCPGDNFAKTIYEYFFVQYCHCISAKRFELIIRVDEEYRNG